MKKVELILGCLIIILYPFVIISVNQWITPFDLALIFVKSLFIYLGVNLYFSKIDKL